MRALVLVPTRELVDQTVAALSSLAYYASDVVSVVGLGGGSNAEHSARLRPRPDVVVATPAKVVPHLASGMLKPSCETVVVDEADLVLGYGYEADVKAVVAALPRLCQGMLLSATLSPALDELKRLVLHSPAVLKLEDGAAGAGAGGAGGAGGGGGVLS